MLLRCMQVTLPDAIRPRFGHSAVMFESGEDFRVVVLFGGLHEGHLTETTLLLFGKLVNLVIEKMKL